MCFRPTGASKPITCPDCNKKIASMGGYKPEKCPHCGAKLNPETGNK